MKIDKTVLKETKYIAAFIIILSMFMQAVFLIVTQKFDYRVLLGNLWGASIALGNFFAMCLYIQKAVSQEEADAKRTMKTSQSVRFSALLLLTGIGVAIPFFDKIAVVIPLLFPSIAVFLRPLFDKNKGE